MIVCHCTGATDRDIRALARSSSKPPADLACPARAAGRAGMYCGGCQLAIEQIVRAEAESASARLTDLVPGV